MKLNETKEMIPDIFKEIVILFHDSEETHKLFIYNFFFGNVTLMTLTLFSCTFFAVWQKQHYCILFKIHFYIQLCTFFQFLSPFTM